MEQTEHNLPYFPCYIADWLVDTQDLTDEQDGAYFRLVRYQWKNGSIPNDMKIMRRIAESIDDTWPVISKFFKEDENGNLINGRTDRERQKIVAKIEAGSKGGSKSSSKQTSKTRSKSTSETGITQNSELRTQNSETQTSELKEILAYFPDSFFSSMAIPNLLVNVLHDYGRDALRAMVEKVVTITDPAKRTAPYVRGIIKNMDLAGIEKGTVSKQGEKLEWLSRVQCVDLASKNKAGKTTDELYRALKDANGENIKFPEGHRYEGQSVWVLK
jgi:uncharacterized protein YdaU (DUF1376 family)